MSTITAWRLQLIQSTTEPDPHIVLGLVGDPGAAFSLASELADTELECELERSVTWSPLVH